MANRTHAEIDKIIRDNPKAIRDLLEDISNDAETEGCDGMATITLSVLNRVNDVLGWPHVGPEDEE